MPNTFLDELSRLNSQNFLGGLAKAGEAIKEQRQNESLANLYNRFSTERQGLATTDEQLSEFNKQVNESGDLTGDKVGNVIDSISKATLNLDKIYKQTDAYENLYRPYITAFATLGEDGVRVANTLSRELESKKETLSRKAEIPFKELEYENAMYQKVQNKMQLMSGAITLDNLKSDAEAQKLLMDIMDTDIGKQIFTFDRATGRSSYKPKEMYTQLKRIYGDNPAFGKAWLLLEKHIYDNMQDYDSASMLRTAKGTNDAMDNAITTYSIMRSMTDKYGQITNSPKYDWVRKAYVEAATAMGRKDIEQIGSSPEVINSIDNAAIREELKWMYEHFYDKSNDEYYWKYASTLKGLTGVPKIKFDENIAIKGLPVPLDMSKVITNEGGWWNPYQTPVHYTQIVKEAASKENAKKQIAELQNKENIQRFSGGKE